MAPTATKTKIEIPYPDALEPTLQLRLGPCRIRFAPSDGPMWIVGSYEDATGALPIEMRPGPVTTIAQSFDLPTLTSFELPVLDLSVGRARPFALEISAGASETSFDLGGLPLARLVIKAGAGRFDVDFSEANPVLMSLLDLGAGAGAFSARHLANANFATLHLGGGIAATTLDFAGELKGDAGARIDAGFGSIDVTVPAATSAVVRTKAFAAAKQATGFIEKGDAYYTQPAVEGKRPLLSIDVSMAFGALALKTT